MEINAFGLLNQLTSLGRCTKLLLVTAPVGKCLSDMTLWHVHRSCGPSPENELTGNQAAPPHSKVMLCLALWKAILARDTCSATVTCLLSSRVIYGSGWGWVGLEKLPI